MLNKPVKIKAEFIIDNDSRLGYFKTVLNQDALESSF
jgi:hypothetical protein